MPLGIALPGGFFGSYGWWRLTGLTVNSRFFDSPPRVPYNIIIYILLFIDMGWGPCIFRLLTVNLLTLPIFQPISMLFDRELIEMGDKKLSLSFFNTFRAS